MGMERASSLLKKGEEISFEIPLELIQQFDQDVRIVIKWPWLIGIPVPEILLKPDMVGKFGNFDVMLTPKETFR